MATTLYHFAPTVDTNYSFQPTLDGTQYNVVVTWSLFGARWIVNVYTLTGTLIVAKPLAASPDNHNINMLGGYFGTTMVFRASTGNFEVTG